MNQQITVKVPGKIMLAGEYDVLRGGPALACTIDKFLTVKATKIPGQEQIKISSNLWQAPLTLPCADSLIDSPLSETVQYFHEQHDLGGVEIAVESELEVSHGVGSSSALRLGVLMACDKVADTEEDLETIRIWDLARESYNLQKKHQSQASGYDIATQKAGGTVIFRADQSGEHWPGMITRLGSQSKNLNLFVHAFVGGKGADTTKTIESTSGYLESQNLWRVLNERSEKVVNCFVELITNPEDSHGLTQLVEAIGLHRKIFEKVSTFPVLVLEALKSLDGFDKSWTFKTTGAGGEDAILLIGNSEDLGHAIEKLECLKWSPAPFKFSYEQAHYLNETKGPTQ